MILSNEEYCSKETTQIERSSFITLSSDITKFFEKKVEDSIKIWEDFKVLDKKWASYIKPSNSKPGTVYGLIKTHKENNPARVITSGCRTAVEFLCIFVENYFYKEVKKIDSRIKDTLDMLNIIDNINSRNIITNDSVLVSFDIVNMFPSIYNILGLEAVSEFLHNRESNFPPTECILDALKRCLECNNSVFNNHFNLQVQ